MRSIKFLIFLSASLFFCSISFSETITLKSGQKVEGDIIEVTKKYIKVDVSGVETTYFMDEIEDAERYLEKASPKEKNMKESKVATPYELKSEAKKALEDTISLPEYKEAVIFASQGKFEEAEKIFKAILEKDKTQINSKVSLKVISDMKQGYIDRETAVLLFSGEVNLINDELQKAIEIFNQVIAKNPDSVEAIGSLGKVYFMLEQYKQAEMYLKKAVQLSSQNPIFYYGLGGVYVSLGQYKEAKGTLLKAAALFKKEGNEDYVKGILRSVASFPDK